MMWERVTLEDGEKRDQELRGEYWGKMLADGSVIHRAGSSDDQMSAQDTIDYLLAKEAHYPLQIQRELVKVNKSLQETEAGRHLLHMLEASLNLYKAKATRLKSLTQEELGSNWELPKDILETRAPPKRDFTSSSLDKRRPETMIEYLK
ncbi:hypothetical protein C0991_003734 [Blastosporella zonata]|nr:hypothetical protein C0991_003734 [Blastosporella zonata]